MVIRSLQYVIEYLSFQFILIRTVLKVTINYHNILVTEYFFLFCAQMYN